MRSGQEALRHEIEPSLDSLGQWESLIIHAVYYTRICPAQFGSINIEHRGNQTSKID